MHSLRQPAVGCFISIACMFVKFVRLVADYTIRDTHCILGKSESFQKESLSFDFSAIDAS